MRPVFSCVNRTGLSGAVNVLSADHPHHLEVEGGKWEALKIHMTTGHWWLMPVI
jgi:hypothetical protein